MPGLHGELVSLTHDMLVTDLKSSLSAIDLLPAFTPVIAFAAMGLLILGSAGQTHMRLPCSAIGLQTLSTSSLLHLRAETRLRASARGQYHERTSHHRYFDAVLRG